MALLDAGVPLQEGAGGDAPGHPLDGHHVAASGHERRGVATADVVRRQARRRQQLKDLARRLIGDARLQFNRVPNPS